VYLLIVLISIIDDFNKKLLKNKFLKYIAYVVFSFKIQKDLFYILEYRNCTSACAILVNKSLQIKGKNKVINCKNNRDYAYYINIIYVNILIKNIGISQREVGLKKMYEKRILDYSSFLNQG